jgi:dolichol kinase
MIEILATLALWGVILLVTELLWHRQILRGEYARKAVHTALSLSIAATPFYLSWQEIQITGIVGVIAVVVIRYSGRIKSTYDISRFSIGDILGPLAIVLLAFFEPPVALFVCVMLHVGLADGMAAVAGTRYGKSNRYKVFGHTKSIAGTAAFLLCSIIITGALVVAGDIELTRETVPFLLLMPLLLAATENVGVYGSDNALILLVTVVIFNNVT